MAGEGEREESKEAARAVGRIVAHGKGVTRREACFFGGVGLGRSESESMRCMWRCTGRRLSASAAPPPFMLLVLMPMLLLACTGKGVGGSAAAGEQVEETLQSMVDQHMESLDKVATQHWGRGDLNQAEEAYKRMAEHRPRHADTFFNIGLVRWARGDLEGCISAVEHALSLPSGHPHHSAYHHQLGVAICKLGEMRNDLVLFDRGIRHLATAVQINPLNVQAWASAATNYMAMGYQGIATRLTDTASRLNPGADSLGAIAINYVRIHRIPEAIRAFKKALSIDPARHRSRVELFHCLCTVADWGGYSSELERVAEITWSQINRQELTFVQPFDSLAHPLSPEMIREIARSYASDSIKNTDQTLAFSHSIPPPFPQQYLPRQTRIPRLKVGYVSADWLAGSAVGRAIGGGIAKHSRDVVEVTCFALRNQRDAEDRSYESGLKVTCENFVALDQVSDYESARRINELGINILVNMNGYTASGRTEIFAYSPAPVQILMQGYAGTSGASFLSHTLVDVVQSPPESSSFYTDKLMMLPISAFRGEGDGNEDIMSGQQRSLIRSRLGLPPSDSLLLANLNRPFKVEPSIFGAWMRILDRAPSDTKLWMFRWPEALPAEGNLLREAAKHGLSDRLAFTDLLNSNLRIAGKALADLFLDTPEYNAHGTATEVLSAGVPVLTLPGGKPHSSRVASSVVLGLGLPELVARTMDDYEYIAGRLVSSRRSLEFVKNRLGAVRKGNRLFDKRWWADGLERCYNMMWDVAMAGEGPMHVISAGGRDHR